MLFRSTKSTPVLSADLLGDWREEVIFPTDDGSELRLFSTTIPTDYRCYTLMHDPSTDCRSRGRTSPTTSPRTYRGTSTASRRPSSTSGS